MEKNTVLPIDSKEGVVLVLRHGMRMTLRDDQGATGFTTITRGNKVRVTSSYAKLLLEEHKVHVQHLGYLSIFEEHGKELDHVISKDIEEANRTVNDLLDDKRTLQDENAALQAQLAALLAAQGNANVATDSAVVTQEGGLDEEEPQEGDAEGSQETVGESAGTETGGKSRSRAKPAVK